MTDTAPDAIPFACPRCDRELDRVDNGHRCEGCRVDFPQVGGLPWLFADTGIEIGPIPAGTPVNLLSNVLLVSDSTDPGVRLEHKKKLIAFLLKAKEALGL